MPGEIAVSAIAYRQGGGGPVTVLSTDSPGLQARACTTLNKEPTMKATRCIPHVLFLPGLLNDASLFQQQIDALTAVTTTEVADLTQANSIADMAESALQNTPEAPCVLVGLSMGGYVAFEIMRRAPERVAGLVLLDTSARPDTAEGVAARVSLMKLAETDLEAVFEQLMPRLSHPLRMNLPAVRGVVHSMMSSLGKDVFIRQQGAIMTRPDSRPGLARIQCPTLVICGRQDLVTPPEMAEEIAHGIPDAQLSIVEDCGHLSTLDQPDEVSRRLLEWVRNIER
ncbi:MAG TPA: alpha/beta fold hydrolase [Zoogloea sp.]|nr:alpha/beta fold hydrolase [Zoogloea sp.]